ncbi:MAG: hypothetical protein SynsKO_31540 [Synoicihabitans sp.]
MQRVDAVLQRSNELADLDASSWTKAMQAARRGVLRQRGADHTRIDEALAFLVVMMERETGRRPYPVQVLGALAMQDGWLIEMATGEGKTLTAALTAGLWAWRWGRCQVVTANDYLARRDAGELAAFYAAAGLRCAAVDAEMEGAERRQNYRMEVTYTTGQQLLADHLRDSLAIPYPAESNRERIAWLEDSSVGEDRLVPAPRAAIIDEADSVLADDAVTPMIISRTEQDEDLKTAVRMAFTLSGELQLGREFEVKEGTRSVVLNDSAQERVEAEQSRFPPAWRAPYQIAFLVTKCLIARFLYHRDQHYVIVEDKIVIVDEKTGRLLPQTTWSDGLHQAVEAKEGIALSDPTKASVKMTCQAFFRGYPHLAGMSGTLANISGEFWRIYELPMVKIPTRLPRRHESLPDQLHTDATAQRDAVVAEIEIRTGAGQPVLVGTRSIRDSRLLGELLEQRHISHVVLNALEHEQEAAIVARAGESGRVTVATNMAGRGTDIRLDGEATRAGGLHVIGTERHDSRRVDNQLIGRASRQGEPGSSVFILSLDDSLLREFLPDRLRPTMERLLGSPGGKALLLGVYRLRQGFLEWRTSRLRVKMLLHEQKLQKALSFARWH